MDAACWVLGGEFEDSVFERRPERRPAPPAPSGAKRCEPQWFYEETESSDDVEILTLKKFRGDLAYRRQEYQKALQEFSSISEKLSPTNFAMKRDVQEGQARCLAHLGRHVEALEIAAALESKATNTDHLTTVLYLQSAVCSSLCNLENIIFCLQKLICLHPLDPWSWQKLAEAYLDLGLDLSASRASLQGQDSFISDHKSVRPSAPYSVFPTGPNSGGSQKDENISKNTQSYAEGQTKTAWLDVQMKACASLIRTRLLLQLAQSQQTSFALERNLRIQQEVEDKVKRLGFSEDTLLLITEMMGEDIVPEKIKEDVHSEVKCVGPAALAALVTASSKEFEDKWFGKIKDHFCPLEHQFCAEKLILP